MGSVSTVIIMSYRRWTNYSNPFYPIQPLAPTVQREWPEVRLSQWTKEINPPDITFVTVTPALKHWDLGVWGFNVMYVAVLECFVHLLYYVVLWSIDVYWMVVYSKLWSYLTFVVWELASRQYTWSVLGNWTGCNSPSSSSRCIRCYPIMRSKHPSPQQHVRCFLFYPNAALLLNAQKHRPAVKQGLQIGAKQQCNHVQQPLSSSYSKPTWHSMTSHD